jgi:hypothetical protein
MILQTIFWTALLFVVIGSIRQYYFWHLFAALAISAWMGAIILANRKGRSKQKEREVLRRHVINL